MDNFFVGEPLPTEFALPLQVKQHPQVNPMKTLRQHIHNMSNYTEKPDRSRAKLVETAKS